MDTKNMTQMDVMSLDVFSHRTFCPSECFVPVGDVFGRFVWAPVFLHLISVSLFRATKFLVILFPFFVSFFPAFHFASKGIEGIPQGSVFPPPRSFKVSNASPDGNIYIYTV
jgi:hypothetical protein